MKVVETFPTSCYDNRKVLRRIDVLVIRLVSPKVGKTVYTPCGVKGEGVPECVTNEESIPDTFIPEVPRYCNWYNDIANCAEKFVMPGIK